MDQATAETTVGIVDHRPVVAQSLAAALADRAGFRVVGCVSDAAHVDGFIRDCRPEVVIVDADFAARAGLDASALRQGPPGADHGRVSRAMRMGANGFVLAASPLQDLLDAVRCAAQGQMWASPPILTALLREWRGDAVGAGGDRLNRLTPREREVLQLLLEGRTLAQIAGSLHVSTNTVRSHNQNLQKKLEVHSAVAAVAEALKAGMRPSG